ncbi:quercetin 2,3-dioxygenase [Nocardioides bruguierae]|uniref:Quercetin 2,3-dioxygenase n=1 Tax=Nocardioides bruguierae TaxID=2945102 RepID=A0A9X2D8S7_9ACTN|nr:quercetin 2,3-dioxygenase [Nocardioides bruguierae]MCM0621431.1 quercetin 2,3-dioxygenase [Nocardioides bruguierae]
MSFEYLSDASGRPAWDGVLPGKPAPFFLEAGEGEHAKLFGDHFTVMLSGDETDGQFGMFLATCPPGEVIPAHTHADTHETFFIVEGAVRVFLETPEGETDKLLKPGDFGFVPSGYKHAYRVEEPTRMLGTATGGFERFFQHMGTLADAIDPASPPYVPEFPQMGAAAQRHHMEFHPQHRWENQ